MPFLHLSDAAIDAFIFSGYAEYATGISNDL